MFRLPMVTKKSEYIYIFVYVCLCVCVCVSSQHDTTVRNKSTVERLSGSERKEKRKRRKRMMLTKVNWKNEG